MFHARLKTTVEKTATFFIDTMLTYLESIVRKSLDVSNSNDEKKGFIEN